MMREEEDEIYESFCVQPFSEKLRNRVGNINNTVCVLDTAQRQETRYEKMDFMFVCLVNRLYSEIRFFFFFFFCN